MNEAAVNRLRLITGLVMFGYITAHLCNLALGLVSLAAMNAMLAVVIQFWGHWLVQVVLLSSISVHFGLAMRALWRRRSLRMAKAEAAQFILGFLIPLMLVLHVSKTRIAQTAYGAHIDYTYELLQFWVRDPWAGAEQVLLLIVAWTHACIGINFNLKLKRWYPSAQPFLLIAACVIPLLALLGFVRAGYGVLLLAQSPEWIKAVDLQSKMTVAAKSGTLHSALVMRIIGFCLLVGLFAARAIRRYLSFLKGTVKLSYSDGRSVRIVRGTSILEASRDAGIPHASICGGRGRCSTCRTRISSETNEAMLPPAMPHELAVLGRMQLPQNVRLACQFRPQSDIAVTPLLLQKDARKAMLDSSQAGIEREITILFCDLRGFTELSEHRLPYDVVFLLNRYFAEMGQAIESSGGHIDKFIGDGIMALFGLECDAQMAARQALAAAARMSTRADHLNAVFQHELPRPLRIGIGIHAGTVIVGDMGWGKTMTLTAIGDCVNTASRLESMTKNFESELIVSEDVERLSRLDLSAWDDHEITVRGRSTPLRIRTFGRARELASANLLPNMIR